MKKKLIIILVALAVIAAASIGYLATRSKGEQVSSGLNPSTYGYNPNYADAIQLKKPELCQNIEYALETKANDAIAKVTGPAAIAACKEQATAGRFYCECDSEATLNAMRVRG